MDDGTVTVYRGIESRTAFAALQGRDRYRPDVTLDEVGARDVDDLEVR
jgi:hypothetical protein